MDVSNLLVITYLFFEPDNDQPNSVRITVKCESDASSIEPGIYLKSNNRVASFKNKQNSSEAFCDLDLSNIDDKESFHICFSLRDREYICANPLYGPFFPVGNELPDEYFVFDNMILTIQGNALQIRRLKSDSDRRKAEQKYVLALMIKREYLAAGARIALSVLKKTCRRPIWILFDRVNMAGDNGEALFEWINRNHPGERDVYFAVNRKSDDYSRLKSVGKVIAYGSFYYRLLHLASEVVLTASGDEIALNPVGNKRGLCRDLLANKKVVFLQHGVTKDNISSWIKRERKNYYGIVTVSSKEQESMQQPAYGYENERIWLTGFPRYDRLFNSNMSEVLPNQITIMPTWRQYLMGEQNLSTGIRGVDERFSSSDFVGAYQELLNSKRLIEKVEEAGYHLAFRPHPNLMPYIDFFHADKRVLIDKRSYNEVYRSSALIISDYSSASFDFSWMYKPVIYWQFDEKEFFSGDHVYTKGYFNYRKDGFGEVEYSLNGLTDRILEYIDNGCNLKDVYRKRIDSFFAFHDNNNCERVYESILRMLG